MVNVFGIADSIQFLFFVQQNQVMYSHYCYSFYGVANSNVSSWEHIVFVKKGFQVSLFVNNQLISTSNTVEWTNNAPPPIGNYSYGKSGNMLFGKAYNTEFMNGSLDDFRIYNRALNLSEVEVLFNE